MGGHQQDGDGRNGPGEPGAGQLRNEPPAGTRPTALDAALAAIAAERPALAGPRVALLAAGGWALVAAGLAAALLASGRPTLAGLAGAAMLVGGFYLYDLALSRERDHRKAQAMRLLPMLLEPVGKMTVTQDGAPAFLKRLPGDHFVRRNRIECTTTVSGRIDDRAFAIADVAFHDASSRRAGPSFRGVIVHVVLETGFSGELLAARRRDGLTGAMRAVLGDVGPPVVAPGDAETDAAWEYRSDDPDAAAARLPLLRDAVQRLAAEWPDADIRVALRFRDGFLLISTGKPLFELPPAHGALAYERHLLAVLRAVTGLAAAARGLG